MKSIRACFSLARATETFLRAREASFRVDLGSLGTLKIKRGAK